MADKWIIWNVRPLQGLGEEGAVGTELYLNMAYSSIHPPLNRGCVHLQSRLVARLRASMAGPGDRHTNQSPEDGERKEGGIWKMLVKQREGTQGSNLTHSVRTEWLRGRGTGRAAREGPDLGLVLEGSPHLQRQKEKP